MTSTQSTLKIGELATGQDLSLPIFSFKASKTTAPSVYIQANIHGAEVQGNAVIYQLMQLLAQYDVRGDITLVPLANLLGINQKSGEFTLGRFDPIPHTLLIPNEFGGAMDESVFCPWWQLSDHLKTLGRYLPVPVVALTLELGDQEHINLDDALVDAQGILAYLSERGVIMQKVLPTQMQHYACYLKDYKKYHAPIGGMVEYLAKVGEPLIAGQPLAQMLRLDLYGTERVLTQLYLDTDCISLRPACTKAQNCIS